MTIINIEWGQTLWGIAKKINPSNIVATVNALAQFNQIMNPDRIYAGETISTPDSKSEHNGFTPYTGQIGDGVMPDTQNLDEEEKFNLYADYLNQFGDTKAQQDLAAGKKVVLTFRQGTNVWENNGQGVYDDRMVIIWQDGSGKHAVELRANADPSGQYKSAFRDMGRLDQGIYTFTHGYYKGNPSYLSTSDQIAERDRNEDGLFNDNSTEGGNFGMHIHIGGVNNTGSAGCITLAPSEYNTFISLLGNQTSLENAVIDVPSASEVLMA